MSPTARKVAWLGCRAGLGGSVVLAVFVGLSGQAEKAMAVKTNTTTIHNLDNDPKLRNFFSCMIRGFNIRHFDKIRTNLDLYFA